MSIFTIGNLAVSLELPAFCRERIHSLITPFLGRPARAPDALFSVETVDASFSIDGAAKRGTLLYREHTPSAFELLTREFRLHVALETRIGILQLTGVRGDDTSLVFNAVKWFTTFLLIHDGGVPLHSSLIADRRYGVLFCGPSGSGKSTIARLLTENQTRLRKGSDELNVLFREAGTVRVAPTPFVSSGGESRFTESKYLRRIFFLRHASQHSIEMVDLQRAFHHLLKNSYTQPGPRSLVERMLLNIQSIAASVGCGIVSFKNDRSVGRFFATEWERFHASAPQS